MTIAGALLALVLVLAPGSVAAAPRVPASDTEVVERLPLKANDPISRELRQLRRDLALDPKNPDTAIALARRYFDLAMAEGDPRYVGYAEAIIRPWISLPEPPIGVVLLRGILRQYRHEFAPATADFDLVLARDPENASALAWRVAMDLVQADYAQARTDCKRTETVSGPLSAAACHAVVDAINGKASSAYLALSAALKRTPPSDPDRMQWMRTRLAEFALRFGDKVLAERHFLEAIAASNADGFVLAAYADFLLDENRPREVLKLLADWVRSDVLLLRLALAEARLGVAVARERIQALADRFSAAALRGERLHLQEEARFELELRRNPGAALRLAVQNWSEQREPRDARILMEAAIAAMQPAAAKPALDWLAATGYEDPRYRALGETLRKMAP